MKKAVWFCLAVVAVAVIALAIFLNLRTKHDPVPSRKASPASLKHQNQLSLPGARAISLLPGSFTDPEHAWVVVSKDHHLQSDTYVPNDLVKPAVPTRTDKTVEEQMVRTQTARAVEAMFADAQKAGHTLMMASGYRSKALQQTYFENYAKLSGREAAHKYSALPGQSEHQTGLSLDISLTSRECYLEICFGDLPAGRWLALHAPEYGFVVRYPSDKTAVTKYQYEPWHFRYVDKPLARALTESKLTLDEAYPYLAQAYNP